MARREAFGLEVNLDSRTPLYFQLAQSIKAAILSGRFQPGQPLPTEWALSQALGLSRATVRQALQELVQAGFLVRARGRGTFVAEAKVEQELSVLAGFSAGIRRLGYEPRTTVLSFESVPADWEVALRLGLSLEDDVLRITRLRSVGDVPLAVEVAHLSASLFPDLSAADLEGSLYDLLATRYGVKLIEADETIEAALAGPDVARWLMLRPGSSLLLTRRTTRDEDGRPIEYVVRYASGQRCRFHVHLWHEDSRLEVKPAARTEEGSP